MSAFSLVGEYWSYFRKIITFIPVFEVVKVSGRYRGQFGQGSKEINDVKLLQLEVF